MATFLSAERRVLLVGGAGFDDRACVIAELLATHASARVDAILFKEDRPRPPEDLANRADLNSAKFDKLIPKCERVSLPIFSDDGNTVIGGRKVVKELHDREAELKQYTDIIVDFSAMSIGVSFPATRYLLQLADESNAALNLHLMVAACPEYDDRIRAIAGDVVTSVHGFRGDAQGAAPAKLWLPQLKVGQEAMLSRLYDRLDPDDTCPILPFPAQNPRLGDDLLASFSDRLEAWEVDPRNVIYASEDDPLDVYRTIVRLNDERNKVFASEGSLLILSPVGSKVVGIGSLMAALEKDLAIRYLEASNYEVQDGPAAAAMNYSPIHIWLAGGPVWEKSQ